jgi:hypothetical protein
MPKGAEARIYEEVKVAYAKLDEVLDRLFERNPVALCIYLKWKAAQLWRRVYPGK